LFVINKTQSTIKVIVCSPEQMANDNSYIQTSSIKTLSNNTSKNVKNYQFFTKSDSQSYINSKVFVVETKHYDNEYKLNCKKLNTDPASYFEVATITASTPNGGVKNSAKVVTFEKLTGKTVVANKTPTEGSFSKSSVYITEQTTDQYPKYPAGTLEMDKEGCILHNLYKYQFKSVNEKDCFIALPEVKGYIIIPEVVNKNNYNYTPDTSEFYKGYPKDDVYNTNYKTKLTINPLLNDPTGTVIEELSFGEYYMYPSVVYKSNQEKTYKLETGGSVTVDKNGVITFDPGDFVGITEFAYIAKSPKGRSVAYIKINVAGTSKNL
jgi:hypothetical protein